MLTDTLRSVSGNEEAAASLAALRFTGARFDRRGVPADVLGEVATCQRMLHELARQMYLRDHPERTNVPAGFRAMNRVRVTAIQDGSSTLLLDSEADGAPLEIGDTYTQLAAEEWQRVLASIVSGHGATHLEYDIGSCRQLGKTLERSDGLTYISASQRSVELDHDSAERVRRVAGESASAQRLPSRPGMWVGSVDEIDTAQGKFRLVGFEGRSRHVLRYSTESVFEQLKASLPFETDDAVCVVCLPELSSSGRAASTDRHSTDLVADIAVVNDTQRVDRYGTLLSRLESFTDLEHGWDADSDHSVPVGGAAKTVARSIISRLLFDGLPLPHAYPVPDGSISLEWGLDDVGINAEIANTADTVVLMSWLRGDGDLDSSAESVNTEDIDQIATWLTARLS